MNRPSSVPWPPLLLLASTLAAFLTQRILPLSWPGLNDWPAQAVGLGFGIAGVALITSAILTLRRHNTTVMPHKASDTLVITGPYQRLRNPIYLGDVFLLFALAEITKNIWFVIFAIVFAVAVTYLAILPEEAHLEARFGDAYRDYKEKTRRWI